MRGIVQIYHNDVLIDESPNLIVDGAAEHLADIMTLSPSIRNIPSASALLDTSNYTIRAWSTGKDGSAYTSNCHASSILMLSAVSPASARVIYSVRNPSGTTSSYQSLNWLPKYPDPLDRMLEIVPSSAHSLIQQFGQNLNVIGLWRFPGLSAMPAFSSLSLSEAVLIGCYPEEHTNPRRQQIWLHTSAGVFVASSQFGSNSFNAFSSMDWRGFIRKDPQSTSFGTGNGLRGFKFVPEDAVNQVSGGNIVYEMTIGIGDSKLANIFGGVSILGMWVFDIPRTLANGISAPFPTENNLDPKLEYKLFAKKVFNRNILYAQDVGVYGGIGDDLKAMRIRWRLTFV